ncbi:MAG TPA: hypothetical protein VIF83_00830, partial [Gemmatimonadaceae bacterium]
MTHTRARHSLRLVILVLSTAAFAACRPSRGVSAPAPVAGPAQPRIVPEPVSLTAGSDPFVLTDSSSIVVDPGNAEVSRTAEQLALILRPSTGFA